MCVVLGVLVYNGSDVSSRDTSAAEPGVPARNSSDIPNADSPRAKLSDLDFVGIVLFLTSVAPLLVGLSLAGSLYRWTQWQVIAPVATGGVFLLLLIVKELCPASVPFPLGSRNAFQKPLLGLRLLKGRQSIVALGGAFWLGLLVGLRAAPGHVFSLTQRRCTRYSSSFQSTTELSRSGLQSLQVSFCCHRR